MSVKNKIVEGIIGACSLLQHAVEEDIFNIRDIVRAGKNVNRLEVLVMEYLSAALDSDIVYSEEFKTLHKPHYTESLEYSRMDEEITPSVLNFTKGNPVKNMIVHNPNGSQSWPDILVIHDNVGYPLEVKSSSSIPKMNSGTFRINTPYLAIKKDPVQEKRKFRFMMGSEMTTAQEIVHRRNTINEVVNLIEEIGAPEYRRCYDNFFGKDELWYPADYHDKHAQALAEYVK